MKHESQAREFLDDGTQDIAYMCILLPLLSIHKTEGFFIILLSQSVAQLTIYSSSNNQYTTICGINEESLWITSRIM